MFKNIKVFAMAIIFTLTLVSFGFSEDLIITTYYPSPNGSYRDLRVSNSLGVGTLSDAWLATQANNDGMIVSAGVNGGLYFKGRNNGNIFAWYSLDGATARLWNSSGGDLFGVSNTGNVYIRKSSEVTNDPLNGLAWYTTGVMPRYCDKAHGACS